MNLDTLTQQIRQFGSFATRLDASALTEVYKLLAA